MAINGLAASSKRGCELLEPSIEPYSRTGACCTVGMQGCLRGFAGVRLRPAPVQRLRAAEARCEVKALYLSSMLLLMVLQPKHRTQRHM